jgi:hypothetical protein
MSMTIFTEHALFQMHRRGISEKDVKEIIKNPEQIEEIRPGRIVMQSRILTGKPKMKFLVRVFVDLSEDTIKIVTVYRTSKIDKYWRL